MTTRTLNHATLEGLASKCLREISKGLYPVIDLHEFSFFELGALGELLSFCGSVKAGKLVKSVKRPVKLIPPESEVAQQFLYHQKIFQFSVSTGGFLLGDNDFAREEMQMNRERDRYHRHDWMAFKQIVMPAKLGSITIPFDSQCKQLLSEMYDLFDYIQQGTGGLAGEEMRTDFYTPTYEVTENIYKHSGSWGMVAAQATQRAIMLFYGDIGVGMAATLEMQKEFICNKLARPWNDATAILAGFHQGFTSSNGTSAGYGLDLVRRYAIRCHGSVSCRSGTARVDFLRDGTFRERIVTPIPGVQISVSLSLNLEGQSEF
jgi:hypothetical protein